MSQLLFKRTWNSWRVAAAQDEQNTKICHVLIFTVYIGNSYECAQKFRKALYEYTNLHFFSCNRSPIIKSISELPGIFTVRFMQNEHCKFLMPCVAGFHTNLENCWFTQQYILHFLVHYHTLRQNTQQGRRKDAKKKGIDRWC